MEFIKTPNLPSARVETVVLAGNGTGEWEKLKASLERRGIAVLELERDLNLAEEVNYHTDLIFHHLGENSFVFSTEENAVKFTEYFSKFHRIAAQSLNIRTLEYALSGKYPGDVPLNAAVVGGSVICNMKHTDPELLRHYGRAGYRLINVAQGYAKCSVCAVSADAAITSDPVILKELGNAGIDAIYADPAKIILNGCKHGFIGGAAGKLSPDTLAFTGRIDHLPDCEAILDFLSLHKVRPVFLTDEDIFDVGSIMPVT
ncbi:MAG: hypothetical protein LBL09_04375 [Oscillospiraceae bacterium]|jgi:hypothetical protein|nr:hypothetical protein [Oscillospiraceae bacterium]